MSKLTRRAALMALAGVALHRRAFGDEKPTKRRVDPLSIPALKVMIEKLKPSFEPFKQTSWSRNHPEEKTQVLDAYVGSKPNRPTAERNKLYIQPLGELPEAHQQAVDVSVEMLTKMFGVAVKTLKPLDLSVIPNSAKRVRPSWGLDQVLTTYVLDDVLKPRRPSDAVAVLGITAADLWPGKDWNYVFGQASLSERVGIWSLYRFGDPTKGEKEAKEFLMRTLKIATHETGHMFGIRHCVHFRCGMNGSNSMPETDEASLAFCPQCVAKLCWACRVTPTKWFEGLIEIAEKHGLEEQKLWADCLALL